jgi:hypothetical protein
MTIGIVALARCERRTDSSDNNQGRLTLRHLDGQRRESG